MKKILQQISNVIFGKELTIALRARLNFLKIKLFKEEISS